MVDRDGANTGGKFGKSIQRYKIAALGAHIKPRKGRAVFLEGLLQFHKDRIVIRRRVNCRNLARTVGRLQGQLYLLRGHAQSCGAVAVNGHAQLRILELQIAIDVLQFRQFAQGILNALGAFKKRPHIRAKQRVLIQGFGRAPAYADGGRHTHKYAHGRRGVEILAQLLGHGLNAGAFVVLGQPHEQNAVVHALAAAHNAHNGVIGRHMG